MAVGRELGGRFSLGWFAENSTSEVDETEITLLTPYGIPGLPSVDRVNTSNATWSVTANSEVLPPKALEPHLYRTEFDLDEEGFVRRIRPRTASHEDIKKKQVHLSPDRWGHSWVNKVWLRADRYVGPENIDPTELPDTRNFAECLLGPASRCLNQILDALVQAGGPADLPVLVPDDFWAVEVEYFVDESRTAWAVVDHLHTLWQRGPRGPEDDVMKRANEILQSGELEIHHSLLVAARRKLNSGDFRGAIIEAVSAVEAILTPTLSATLDSYGISNTKQSGYLGPQGLGLSQQVHVAVPTLFGREAIPKELRSDFKAANSTRNNVVHEGEDASEREAVTHLETCSQLIERLRELRDQASD